jgi:hypothetical protein
MNGLKANSTMADLMADTDLASSDRQRRDSLFVRRLIGGVFVIGLALLGLAFPRLI